jgi:hypothetical protein
MGSWNNFKWVSGLERVSEPMKMHARMHAQQGVERAPITQKYLGPGVTPGLNGS